MSFIRFSAKKIRQPLSDSAKCAARLHRCSCGCNSMSLYICLYQHPRLKRTKSLRHCFETACRSGSSSYRRSHALHAAFVLASASRNSCKNCRGTAKYCHRAQCRNTQMQEFAQTTRRKGRRDRTAQSRQSNAVGCGCPVETIAAGRSADRADRRDSE